MGINEFKTLSNLRIVSIYNRDGMGVDLRRLIWSLVFVCLFACFLFFQSGSRERELNVNLGNVAAAAVFPITH